MKNLAVLDFHRSEKATAKTDLKDFILGRCPTFEDTN
jgi:hypothetical protein